MTTVGHSLMGLTIGVFAIPSAVDRKWKALIAFVFVALANLPDWPIPLVWGHDHYLASHSFFVNGLVFLVVAAPVLLWTRFRAAVPAFRLVALGGLVWASHLLLDATYNHGQGLSVCWPFWSCRLRLTLPWFSTLGHGWHFDLATARILALEMAAYGALLAVAVAGRALWLRRGNTSSR